MRVNTKILTTLFAGLLLLASCKKDNNNNQQIQEKPTPYTLQVPPHFPKPIILEDNPLTVEGILLGRMLFYDKILSSNNRACGSCHVQSKSFINSNVVMGLDKDVYHNIPPFINLAWNPDFGWNGGDKKLDLVAINDFGPLFFNSNMDTVVARLNRHSTYPTLFRKVFGEDVITKEKIQKASAYAIAQFIRTIVASDSKFDKYLNGKAALTAAEERGMLLFFSEKGDCFHCHGGVLLTDNSFHNIGLDDVFDGLNRGLFDITGNDWDKGKFSTPTLRNIELTAPYMHDGRFATLEEVVQHYNKGVKKSATLDPIMTKAGKETGLNLSTQDVQDLVAFMKTFTDYTILTNPQYASPF